MRIGALDENEVGGGARIDAKQHGRCGGARLSRRGESVDLAAARPQLQRAGGEEGHRIHTTNVRDVGVDGPAT